MRKGDKLTSLRDLRESGARVGEGERVEVVYVDNEGARTYVCLSSGDLLPLDFIAENFKKTKGI